MAQRIALFGGSFNPIHIGHLIAARSVAERADIDRIVFLPSADPPHKTAGESIEPVHLKRMVSMAIEGESGFEIDEYDLRREGPTFTVDTVAHFAQRCAESTQLFWIIGADSLADLHTWRDVPGILSRCDVLTAARPGWESPDLSALRRILDERRIERLLQNIVATPRIDVSARDIRERVRGGRSIRYLVPEAVRQYIFENALYQ